jgi:hypothetical protein
MHSSTIATVIRDVKFCFLQNKVLAEYVREVQRFLCYGPQFATVVFFF